MTTTGMVTMKTTKTTTESESSPSAPHYPPTPHGTALRIFDEHGHHLRWATHWRCWIYATPGTAPGWAVDHRQERSRACARAALTAQRRDHAPPPGKDPPAALLLPDHITQALAMAANGLAIAPADLDDPLGRFLDAYYAFDPGAHTRVAPLVAAFLHHCAAHGIPHPGSRRTIRQLRTRFRVRPGADNKLTVYGLAPSSTPSDQGFPCSVDKASGQSD